jgi:hypothetical protein
LDELADEQLTEIAVDADFDFAGREDRGEGVAGGVVFVGNAGYFLVPMLLGDGKENGTLAVEYQFGGAARLSELALQEFETD